MHKSIAITPVALQDLQDAIEYYNEQLRGLGIRFENNVNNAFVKIRKMPKSASFVYGTVRYKVVEGFPFTIIYEELETQIAIIRVFNTHKKP